MDMESAKKNYLAPGYTLVEIMVAMLIALIVMGGVYRTLSDETVNQDRSEKILDMQNNARVALERIARDVRRAGALGCGGTPSASIILNSVDTATTFIQDLTLDPDPPSASNWPAQKSIIRTLADAAAGGTAINFVSEVMGFNDNAAPGHVLYQGGTDTITLVYLAEEHFLTAAMNPGAAITSGAGAIPLDSRGFHQDDLLYITDCTNYTLFQKTDSDLTTSVTPASSGLNNSNDLLRNYGSESSARIFKLDSATYFISNDGKFELCRNASNAQIASNIEDLQFEFLADENTDGDLNDDIAAGHWRTTFTGYPTGGQAVRAVRIWVLAMSDPDFGYSDTNTYDYPNSPYAASSPAAQAPIASPPNGEHRHRYLASAVVYLRNAGLQS